MLISVLTISMALVESALLLFAPELGLRLFWGLLIPVAPLLLFLAPGLWRQICPLGSVALLPRDLGWTAASARIPTEREGSILRWVGLAALLALPPLRPWFIDKSGLATFLVVLVFSGLAFFLGTRFVGRGAFCNGLCPVHFVEMIYGQFSRPLRLPVRCGSCDSCTTACVDVHEGRALDRGQDIYRHAAWGLPGFVIGWFLIPQDLGTFPLPALYGPTLGGFLASFLVFAGLDRVLGPSSRRGLVRAAALLALGAYYWFQVPRLACLWTNHLCLG
ncbi:MAG: hypothetical protein HUU37_03290 [Bdellovibrionales bacterium]|nr:hypothetical protein [Bdellovibrionales bacterium]